MVSVSLPSDALLQYLPSYLGFSYLGPGVSLHGCSSKAQPLLLSLEEGYLLTAAVPDFQRGIAQLECSNYHTVALIPHTSQVMLKILQARLQECVTENFQMFKLDLEKAEEQEIKLPTSV